MDWNLFYTQRYATTKYHFWVWLPSISQVTNIVRAEELVMEDIAAAAVWHARQSHSYQIRQQQ